MEPDPDQELQKFPVPQQVNADQAVLSLMAMAENFRIAKIPKYKMAIKCVLVNFCIIVLIIILSFL